VEAAEARFTDLYEAHYRHVLAFLLRRTGCTSTAQDLTEDVFLVAWRKLDDIPDGDEAAYWLFGVARKTLSAHDRKAIGRMRIAQRWLTPTNDRVPQPDDVVIRRDEDRILERALNRLRDRDRELILMAYWDELPHAAIAELLGISRSNVDVRLHRAIRRLGKELQRSDHVWVEGLATKAPKESEC
jgi:RNA polymerase sigma-70 factor (ECF subfamily)